MLNGERGRTDDRLVWVRVTGDSVEKRSALIYSEDR